MPLLADLFLKTFDFALDKYGNTFINELSINRIPKIWEQVFIKVATNSNQISEKLSTKLAKSRAILRFYYSTFDPIGKFPTEKELAVAIGMEVLDHFYDISCDSIRHYAVAVRKEWIRTLISDEILNKHLLKNGKNPLDYLNEEKNFDNEIINILNDKNLLRRTFFKSYSIYDATDIVKVWLPDKNGTITWNEELSIDIRFNPFIGFDLGFFRINYDYAYICNDNQIGSLIRASISPDNDREAAEFQNKTIGIQTDSYIWLL